MKPRVCIALGIVLAALGIATWFVWRSPASGPRAAFTYTMRVEYDGMPDEDGPLEQWLRGQSGVGNVEIRRNGKVLTIMHERAAHEQPLDVLAECERLGYTGRGSFEGRVD